MQRCKPSDMGDKIGAVAAVHSETGTELGCSDPAAPWEKSDRGALIKLTNLEATSQLRNKNRKKSRSGNKSSRQLLGTKVQVNGNQAVALLDPGYSNMICSLLTLVR